MRFLGNKESILTEISNLLSNKGLLQKVILSLMLFVVRDQLQSISNPIMTLLSMII